MRSKILSYRNVIIFGIILLVLVSWQYFLPLVGDDWGWGSTYPDLLSALERGVELWRSYNGRVLGHALVFLMSAHPLLKVIVMALTFALLIYFVSLFASSDKKKICWLMGILLVIGMPFGIYREVFAWMSGFSNFGIPVLVMVVYLGLNRWIFDKKKFKVILENDKLGRIIGSFGLGFMMNLFAEHSAIFSVILGLGMIIITYLMQKRFVKSHLAFLVGAVIGCGLMFASPSYWSVMAREEGTALEGLSLFGKIIYNIKNSSWFMDICINNTLLNVVLVIIFIVKIKEMKGSKLYLGLTVVLSLLAFVGCPFIVYTNRSIGTLLQIGIVFLMFVCVIGNFFLLYFKKDVAFFIKIVALYMLSYVAAMPLLAAVGFGPRCFINSYLLQCICVACVFGYESGNFGRKIYLVMASMLVAVLGVRIFATAVNYLEVKERDKGLTDLKSGDVLVVKPLTFRYYIHQSGIPATPYHETVFKTYHNIDQGVKIEIEW